MGRRPRARDPSARPAKPAATGAVGAAVLWSSRRGEDVAPSHSESRWPREELRPFGGEAQAQEQIFLPHTSRRHLPLRRGSSRCSLHLLSSTLIHT
jgi:hypothetical protein